MSQYDYTISTAFPNGAVDPTSLSEEIEASSITVVLSHINTSTAADVCSIFFDTDLSGAEQTTLDGVVAAHTGVPALSLPSGTPGWNLRVEDRNLTDPPGSPQEGVYYVVAAGGTGDWAGWDDSIAGWNGTTWQFQRPTVGLAVWVIDEDVVVVYVDDTTKWASYGSPGGGGSVFGSDLHLAESKAVSTTTNATHQNKITMVTATLTAGVYRLEVSYGWNQDTNTSDFEARVQQDGVTIGEPHRQEPKDSAGSWGATGTDQRHYTTRVFHLSLAAQSYTFTLQWSPEYSGNEASIWDAYMTLWRMS